MEGERYQPSGNARTREREGDWLFITKYEMHSKDI